MNEDEWSAVRLELEQSHDLTNHKIIKKWASLGYPVPPPSAYKQELIKRYAKKYNLKILVETGTYLGDTVSACLEDFEQIFSIELSQDLYDKVKDQFKDNNKVHLYHGDSAIGLSRILKKIKASALFWLDAHYSGGITAKSDTNTPIMEELELILRHKIKDHLILVDDSRLFVGQEDYPTLAEVESLAKVYWPECIVVNRFDVIRIQPDHRNIEVDL